MHHIPALSALAVFIDLKSVKPSCDQSERNDFLLQDLQVKIDEVADIWPEPESQLLYVAFFTEEQHQLYLGRLSAGVPWSACRGALVFGWAPGDAVTAVRLTGVPAALPDDCIRAHFSQFGRVTRLFRSKDKVFTKATNGIAHISIAVAPGFTLPAFVSLVDQDGATDKRMLVYTDAFRRRCSRCGTTGHVAQFCKAGRRAAGADEALWSTLRIPASLLPTEEMAKESSAAQPPPPPPIRPAGFLTGIFNNKLPTAAAGVPPLVAMARALSTFNTAAVPIGGAAPAAEAASPPSTSTPSSSTLPGGTSGTGPVGTAREDVAPTGGAAPVAGAALLAVAGAASTPSASTMPGGTSGTGPVGTAREVVAPTGGAAHVTAAAAKPADPSLEPADPKADLLTPTASTFPSLALQLSDTSASSLPLGQGGPPPPLEQLEDTPDSSQGLSLISTISQDSSQDQQKVRAAAVAAAASLRITARSRSPRSNRSASNNSRGTESDAETSYSAGATPKSRKRAARMSRAAKATKKPLTSREVSLSPSQDISDCTSP
jgi:hypothetical protein